MTMLEGKCDVCHVNAPVGVACSPFAAFSMAYCIECLHKPADAESIFQYLWEDVANFNLDNLHPYVFEYYTYRDGAYHKFKDWVEKFGRKKEEQEVQQ